MAEARAARLPLRAMSTIALLVALALTLGVTWAVHLPVHDRNAVCSRSAPAR